MLQITAATASAAATAATSTELIALSGGQQAQCVMPLLVLTAALGQT